MLDENTYAFMTKWNIALVDSACPILATFRGGALITHTADLQQFGDGADPMIYVDELEKYLDNLGCLHSSHSDLKRLPFQASDDDSDEENSASYCDIDGCGRYYPHEHVTAAGGGGTLSGAAAADKGAEALAKDWCYKV
jgi:hypothetical protein